MAGIKGINIRLNRLYGKTKINTALLFSETQGRILVTVSRRNKERFESIFKNIQIFEIGEVNNGDKFCISESNKKV